jgi:5,10-methenyltetrahydrofolate synthetase
MTQRNSDDHERSDVLRWRKAERERLIEARLAIAVAERQNHSVAIAAALDEGLGNLAGRTVSAYWPIRGEPDLRPWLERICAQGGTCALPVVTEPRTPLVFRAWRPGARMERGFWNIPVPADGAVVTPDIVIAPVVGFDADCYRLGYGGGYFDRTLAAMSVKPQVIGVGYAYAAIATIHPLSHDIAMTMIVTERGISRSAP